MKNTVGQSHIQVTTRNTEYRFLGATGENNAEVWAVTGATRTSPKFKSHWKR